MNTEATESYENVEKNTGLEYSGNKYYCHTKLPHGSVISLGTRALNIILIQIEIIPFSRFFLKPFLTSWRDVADNIMSNY